MYDVEIEYVVTELITVEADSHEEAEDKALQMALLGITDHNIVSSAVDEAEVTSSSEAAESRDDG